MASQGLEKIERVDVAHPGETVLEYLDFLNWSQRDLARRAGISPKTISEICNGKAPISATTSLAFEKVFKRPAHLWLNLQRLFDESVARKRAQDRAKDWRKWAKGFPLAEMKDRGWLPEKDRQEDEVDSLLSFFGVSSPSSWDAVWEASRVAYRQTRNIKTSFESISVWVRATEILAAEMNVGEFDERRLRSSISELRRLTMKRADKIIQPMQAICGDAGVYLVFVPELRHTGISGCARWLSSNRALIALTLRYKTDDQLWFTFFHELAHVLLHRRTHAFILDNAEKDLSDGIVDPTIQKQEDEANRFAADTLIPPDKLEAFITYADFGNDAIKRFAESVGVSPGIVVGRLQFERLLKPFQGNAFKQNLGVSQVSVH